MQQSVFLAIMEDLESLDSNLNFFVYFVVSLTLSLFAGLLIFKCDISFSHDFNHP